jgi:hypothetical protein
MSKDIKDYLHLYLGCECINEEGKIGRFSGIDVCKLLLRPLSDMTQEEFRIDCNLINPVERFRFRLSKGFDLFGLIDAGLALDATKLQQP